MNSRRVQLRDESPPGRILWCGLFLAIGLLLALAMCGCTSTDPCPPCEPIVTEVPVPVYPDVPELPPLDLEPLPEPPEDAGPGWWIELQFAIAEREAQLLERIDELMAVLRKLGGGDD
jgi:hypothetical protein